MIPSLPLRVLHLSPAKAGLDFLIELAPTALVECNAQWVFHCLSRLSAASSLSPMATSEEIFRDAMTLPPDARAELTERLVESLAQEISPEITSAQLAEVRRRIAQVEAGEVELIPGDEALARVRNLLAQHLPSS
jgi:putative addiction module component (TIGR02574 family)